MAYFDGIKNLAEIKKEFRRLALIHHPDRGGNVKVMQAVVAAYQDAVKSLKDKAASKTSPRARAKSGSSNVPAPMRAPRFSHREICIFAKSIFAYARQQGYTLQSLYRLVCRQIDPGQTDPYQDYLLTPSIARKSLKELRRITVQGMGSMEFWSLIKSAQDRLAA